MKIITVILSLFLFANGTVADNAKTRRYCKKILELDGPGGFLWKESDHIGLVVLLPKEYRDIIKVQVAKRRKGKRPRTLETLRLTGFANGDRMHVRSDRSITDFPNKWLFVRVIYNRASDGRKTKRCWHVRLPHQRQD